MNEDLMITGSWMNKRTGERITVRNSIIDGDDMILITDKGQLSMTEFSNDYIQVSDEIYDENNKVIGKGEVDASEFIMDDYHDDSIFMKNTPKSSPKQPIIKEPEEPQSYKILDKFFNKIENKEDLIKVSVDFSILPKNELKTIIEYLDVSLEDMSKYISEKLVSQQTISEIIFNKLNDEYFSSVVAE